MQRPKFIATAAGQVVIFEHIEAHKDMLLRLGLDGTHAGFVSFPDEKGGEISYFGNSTSTGLKADGLDAPEVQRWYGAMLRAGTPYEVIMLTNDKTVFEEAGHKVEKAEWQGLIDDCGIPVWVPCFGEITLRELAIFSGRYGPSVSQEEVFALDE